MGVWQQEHSQTVSAVEWAPQTNKLLSASHDRNAFVWQQNAGRCPSPFPPRVPLAHCVQSTCVLPRRCAATAAR